MGIMPITYRLGIPMTWLSVAISEQTPQKQCYALILKGQKTKLNLHFACLKVVDFINEKCFWQVFFFSTTETFRYYHGQRIYSTQYTGNCSTHNDFAVCKQSQFIEVAQGAIFMEGLRTPRKSFFSKIRNFWAWADKLG